MTPVTVPCCISKCLARRAAGSCGGQPTNDNARSESHRPSARRSSALAHRRRIGQEPARYPGFAGALRLSRLRSGRSQRLRQIDGPVRMCVRLPRSGPRTTRVRPEFAVPEFRESSAAGVLGLCRAHRDRVPLSAPRRSAFHAVAAWQVMGAELPGPHGCREAKPAVGSLASDLNRTVPDVARIVGQREAEANAMPELTGALAEQINAWSRL